MSEPQPCPQGYAAGEKISIRQTRVQDRVRPQKMHSDRIPGRKRSRSSSRLGQAVFSKEAKEDEDFRVAAIAHKGSSEDEKQFGVPKGLAE